MIRLDVPLDLDMRSTVGPLGMKAAGRRDLTPDRAQWASHTPDGPAAVTMVRRLPGVVEATAAGPGAEWLLGRVPDLLGLPDDPEGFNPPPGLIATLHRRSPGLRLARTGRVFDAVLPAVLGQKVTSQAAVRSYRALTRRFGARAPSTDLWLPPGPDVLAELPYWEFHDMGVERKRASVIVEAARRAGRLEEALLMDRGAAYRRITAVRGIGDWTAGHVMGVAWGDVDAVPTGDYHLPNTVAWALAGEDRADDERMLELLEPYAGQRRRALLLIKGAGIHAPKYGPRRQVSSFEAM